jgi:hypothetical protein
MKKNIYNSIKIALAVITSSTLVIAQCPQPDKIVKAYGKDKYVVSTQSRSGALKPGESEEYAFIAQEGYDYRISTAVESKDGAAAVYEIYELVTEKVGEAEFKKVKKIITSSDGSQAIVFSLEKSRKLVVKVTLQGSTNPKPTCVGLLIEDRKSTKIGFQ